MKPRMTHGSDGISNASLQRLPKIGVLFLVVLYNAFVDRTCFPLMWIRATVILISHPGKYPRLVKNLRPISLLSHTSNVFQRLIQHKEHFQRLDIFIPGLFGFQEKHSSIHQMMRIVQFISGDGCSGDQTVAFFLDVEQAFHDDWHNGLHHKLRETTIPVCYFHLIAYFLRNRTFYVRVDSALSQERRITASVPRGSILGPLLFTAYINDMPKLPVIELWTFTDDTAAYAVGQNAEYVELDSTVS